MRRLLIVSLLGSLLSACRGEPAAFTATLTGGSVSSGLSGSTDLSTTGSTSAASGNASSSQASSTSATATATTTGSASTQSTGEGSSPSSTSFLWDVGSDLDLDDGLPIGCKTKKIDFLFVVGKYRYSNIEPLGTAWPVFIDTITSKFEDFDDHIMVIDADSSWSVKRCNNHCPSLTCLKGEPCCQDTQPPGENCCNLPGYPCALMDLVGKCDETLGSGMVIPATYGGSYTYCKIDDNRRYLTKDQHNIHEAFVCIATVGIGDSTLNRVGDALEAALSPEFNAPGGCNEGFLRDDALLMVTIASTYGEGSILGTYPNWYWSLRLAKDNNPDAIAMFVISEMKNDNIPCHWADQKCALAKQFTHHVVMDTNSGDFNLRIDEATDMIFDICEPPPALN